MLQFDFTQRPTYNLLLLIWLFDFMYCQKVESMFN